VYNAHIYNTSTKIIGLTQNLFLCIAGGRLETELRYSESALGETESVIHLLVTQTAKESISPEVPQQRLLHKKALLAHLQLLKVASHVTVNLYDVYVN